VLRSPRPGPHPPPPEDLSDRDLPLVQVSGPLHRIHRAARAPLFFGKTGENRFDDPGHAFGVLYAGESEACAFIETFAEPLDVPFVALAQLAARKLSAVEVTEPLRLVSLVGADLRRFGADARLFAGDHAVAQAWARALHEHPGRAPTACGIPRATTPANSPSPSSTAPRRSSEPASRSTRSPIRAPRSSSHSFSRGTGSASYETRPELTYEEPCALRRQKTFTPRQGSLV
jgi:hypothetical protein